MPPPSKRAVKLTRAQAREMQDLLIAGYEAEEFQKKLHMIWFITDDHVARVRKRQELCLEVQGPIIAKFGYEPNRKGVAESVAAFNAPELLFDAEIQEYNNVLGYLVNPDAQLGSTGEQPEAALPTTEGPAVASQTTPPPGHRKPAREPPRAAASAAPKRPIHRERPPEQQFLLKFRLAPPGGFISQSTELSEDAAISMLDELITGFSSSQFQQQLRGVYGQAGNNPRKLSALRQELTMKIQIPIVAKYGFEESFDGVLCSAQAFTPELTKNPEIAQKNCLVFWLIDPIAQAHTPVPSGPAPVALYVIVKAHNESGLVCSVNMDMSSNVKSLKENIQLKAGIPVEAQKLLVSEHTELEDGAPLSRLMHVGGTLDVWVATRPDHVVEWLKKVHRGGADVLQGAPASLLGDLEFLLPAIRTQVRVLQYADVSIRSCRELLLKFVQHSGQALQFATSELQADLEVVQAAVRQDGWALQFAAAELQASRDVVLAAVSEDGWAFQFAATALRADREIVLKAASKDAWIIGNAAPELRNDREIVLTAVKQDWRVLEAIDPALRGDREVMLAAVKQDGWALEFAPAPLQGDRELVLEAVRRTGEALRFAAKELCSDRELCMAAVSRSGCSLALVTPEIQDVELVLAATKQDPRALQFVEPRLRDAVKAALGISHVPAWDNRRGAPGLGATAAGAGRGPDTSESGRWVMPTLKKHFDLLGLHESSKPEEIKKQYKVLALKHHPDKHPQDPEGAKAKFQAINNAFQAIKEALGL